MNLCTACGKHPSNWRGFCTLCAQWLGVEWRRRITEGGQKERRRAIEAIQKHLASFKRFQPRQ